MFFIYLILMFIIFSFLCMLCCAKKEDEYLDEYFRNNKTLN